MATIINDAGPKEPTQGNVKSENQTPDNKQEAQSANADAANVAHQTPADDAHQSNARTDTQYITLNDNGETKIVPVEDSILTFFGPSPAPVMIGEFVQDDFKLDDWKPGESFAWLYKLDFVLDELHYLPFILGVRGPLDAGFPTLYMPQNYPLTDNWFYVNNPNLWLIQPLAQPAVILPPPVQHPEVHVTDLAVVITPHAGTVVPGTLLTYDITITNNGPTDVTNFDFSKILPPNLISPNLTQGLEDGSFLRTIKVGESITTTISGIIDPFATGTLDANTRIHNATPNVPDTNPDNDHDRSQLLLTPEVDLGAVKQDNAGGSSGGVIGTEVIQSSIGVMIPGESYTYTVSITNTGPSGLTSITFTDILPMGFSVSDYSTSIGNFLDSDASDGIMSGVWSGLHFKPGDVITMQISGYLDSNLANLSHDGQVINKVIVGTPDGVTDTNPNNNVAIDIDNINTVVKSDNAGGSSATGAVGTFVAGGAATYTITISNLSPNAETGHFSDPLNNAFVDAVWSVVGANGASAATMSGSGAIADLLLSLPANSSLTFTISGHVLLTATGTIHNQATFTPNGSVPVIVIDSDNIVTLVKTDSGGGSSPTAEHPNGVVGTFVAGETAQYYVTVTNTSGNDVHGSFIDPLNQYFLNSSWTATGTGGGISAVASGSGAIIVPVDIYLPAHATITFTFTGEIALDAPEYIHNTASFIPLNGDPVPVTDTDKVINEAHLEITKDDGKTYVVAGEQNTYTITISNTGPSNAYHVVVADTLPIQGLLNASSPDATYDVNSHSWILGTLAPGQTVILTLTGTVSPTASGDNYTNTVTATSDDAPTVQAHDTDILKQVVDLGVTKTDGISSIVAGTHNTYTIVVTNYGPSTLTSFNLVDAFTQSSFWHYDVNNGIVASTGAYNSSTGVWSGLNLASGQSVTLTLNGVVDAAATGSITNTVTVSHPNDHNPNNNTAVDTDVINQQVDLGVTKTDGIATIIAGAHNTYTIVVTNAGPSTVTSFTLLDTFTQSSFWHYDAQNAIIASTGSYNASTGLWSGLNLATGQSVTLTLNGTVDAGATGSITNTVTVSHQADTNSNNNTAVDTDLINQQVDLGVAKTDGKTAVIAGEHNSYTITVTNTGPSTVTSFTLTDVFTQSSFWHYDANNGVVASNGSYNTSTGLWSGLNLASGQSITLTLNGTVDAGATGSITNTVTVSHQADNNPNNNTAVDTDIINQKVDLSVTKTDGITTVIAGAHNSYTIVVTNAGPSTVTSFSLIDTFTQSSFWHYDVNNAIIASTGSYNSSTGVWSGLNLATGQSVTLTLNGTVDAGATGSITNTVTVSHAADTNPNNNTAVDTDIINQQVDLGVAKTDGKTAVIAGEHNSYTITVTNTGPSTVTSFTLTDVFTQSSFWHYDANNGVVASNGSYNTSTGLWSGLNLASGQSITLTLNGTVDAGATGSITNTVTVSHQADNNPNNNTAVDTDIINQKVDLSVTKTDGITTVIAGAHNTYTIVVTNAGPSTITSFNLTDTFTQSSFWHYDVNNGIVASAGAYNSSTGVWSGLSLASGQSVTLTLNGTVDAGATGSITNTVTVSHAADTNPNNNTAVDTDVINQKVDLGVTKTDGITTVIAGAHNTYTIVVTNTGPSNVTSFSLTDTFTQSSFWHYDATNAIVASAGSYNAGTGIWSGLNLAAGQSVTLTLNGTVDAGATGSITNTVTVSHAADNNPNNNTAVDTDVIKQQVDLGVTKTDGKDTIVAGAQNTYTITVVNNGPSTINQFTLVDVLPNGFSASSYLASIGTYNSTTGLWSIAGGFASGQTVTLTINGTVSASATGTLTNVADVSVPVGVTDSNPNNNHAVDTTLITPECDVSIIKTASVAVPYIGQTETYTLAVKNTGPSNAATVTVSDPLPQGVSYVAGSASNGGVYNSATNTITWNLGSLAPNATQNLTFQVKVNNYAFEQGSTSAGSLSALQSAWGFTSGVASSMLHSFALGASFINGSGNLDLAFANSNGVANVSSNWNASQSLSGIGVNGITSQIDTSNGKSESMVIDLGQNNISSAQVTLAGLGNGQVAQAYAYDAAGHQVGGPILIQGSSNGGDVGTVTLSFGADFRYIAFQGHASNSGGESSFYVQDIKAMPDIINNTGTVTTTTPDTNPNNNTSTTPIDPSEPTNHVAYQVIAQGAISTNLLLVIDRSGSMGDNVTINGQTMTKLQAAKNAINTLLDLYGDAGNVAVKIVQFNNTASILTSSWVSLTAAEALLASITATGTTNYDAALGLSPNGTGINYTAGAEDAWTTTGSSGAGYITGGQNVLYFLTDGGPNEPGNGSTNSAGINSAIAGNAGETTQWQNFLTNNNITAYSVSMGLSGSASAQASGGDNNITIAQELTPIASSSSNTIFASSFSQLSAQLSNTVINHTGNLVAEASGTFGAGGAGFIQSVALIGDGRTYSYNAQTDTVTQFGAGSSTFSFDSSSHVLTISSTAYGTIAVYMENNGTHVAGDYTYTAPSSILTEHYISAPIQFNLADSQGNIATGMLNITTSHDTLTVTNNSAFDQGLILTIVDLSNTQNSFSQVLNVEHNFNGTLAFTLSSDFDFNSGSRYAISLEQDPNNTAALSITSLMIDGINLHTGSTALTLGPGGSYAATYVIQDSSATPVQGETLASTSASDSLVHYLHTTAAGANLSAHNTSSNSLADFLNGDGANSTVNNTRSSPSVMVYDQSNTYNGNGHDILRIDQAALGTLHNTSLDINLTGNNNIHNIGQILLTTGQDGKGANLTLNASDVLDFTNNAAGTASGNNNTLYINGGSGNTVNIGSGWTDGGVSNGYHQYTQNVGAATDHLFIQAQVHVVAS